MEPPGKLAGARAMGCLAEDMATKNALHLPNTFGRARIILIQANKDIIELGLNYFPALKFRDAHGGKCLWWIFAEYVQILRAGAKPLPISQVAILTLEV